MKENKLPKTREEFESRALLFQILNYTEDLLYIKKDFAKSLTDEEKKNFWSLQDKYCDLPQY